jgi:nicotinate-nucleotide adenylyltransferase
VRIAILGGSFNPVHIAHLALAESVHCALGYDLVLLVPASIPPHKALASGATAEDRIAMLKLAIADASFLVVEECEIDRGGVSYTIDTVSYLEEKYRDRLEGKIGLVIGEDLVAGFDTWKDAPVLAERTDVIVARRPSKGDRPATFPYRHAALDNALLPISSSSIREAVRHGKGWRYLVPDGVYRYIVEHTLYES